MLAIGCAVSMTLGLTFVRPVLHPSLAPSPTADVPDNADEVDVSAAVPVSVSPPQQSERTPLLRSTSTKSVQERNVAGLALFRELDFYLIFLFNGLCAGIGLCYINNLGTVVRSLALHAVEPPSPHQIALAQTRLVSLLSFCNFLGRLLSGFGSDYLVHNKNEKLKTPRVWWLVFGGSLFFVSQVAAMRATQVEGVLRGLTLPTMLTGLAHGVLFGLSGIVSLERCVFLLFLTCFLQLTRPLFFFADSAWPTSALPMVSLPSLPLSSVRPFLPPFLTSVNLLSLAQVKPRTSSSAATTTRTRTLRRSAVQPASKDEGATLTRSR